jgi:hypothetical protein
MKKICFYLFTFFAILQAAGQDNNSDLVKLKALNATFINDFVTNDTISHSKIIDKEFVCLTNSGAYINRKDYMNGWLHGFDTFKYWDYRDENIKIFGTTALVHAQNKYVLVQNGKEITGMSMYTDTYIKENGQWKCVQAQLTKVAPENFAGDETIVRKYDYRNK